MKYIDLTMPLNTLTPVYPGDPKVQIDRVAQFDADGYLDHSLQLGTHNGTHIDAPAHMVRNGKMLNEFTVDRFIGNGSLIDVRSGFNLETLEHAAIKENNIVLFYTGASEDYMAPSYYDVHPVINDDAARYVITRRVKMVGIDTGSVDEEPFAVHKALLSHNILIIENLVNLRALLGKKFELFALPLNLGVEGSPARVVARLL